MSATTAMRPRRGDNNARYRAASVDSMVPPLHFRPRTHSLSRLQATANTAVFPRPKSFMKKRDVSSSAGATESPPTSSSSSPADSTKHVQWGPSTGIPDPTYMDVDSYDDLIFQVGGLDKTKRSIPLEVTDFLARAATHLGYVFESFPTVLDCSKLRPADIKCWQRLYSFPWELEAEFDHICRGGNNNDTMDVFLPHFEKSFLKRLFSKPKPALRVSLDKTDLDRLRCIQEIVNACLSFGTFQFTLHDLARLCIPPPSPSSASKT
ncbi:Aste57867_19184 [Aphanomyces stellatus]|uniref:Aste57867_19184 protein n=1 Tax=Aphanomyces stellatus TaxID=120398 RepID=A0A485LG85_9STRA|nr:hypothetical protein As57867_019120 [Aphanomyces stellatus]VFT95906.1 Aste57867_19184 [Aphanomyces stellatus]